MPISRRGLVKVVGLGAAAAVTEARATPAAAHPVTPSSTPNALVHPLTHGSRFGRWTLEQVVPTDQGASYVLSDGSGARFQVDVCARDADIAAPHGPAHTERFELFLANEGNGSTDTHEDHGLAAMALAEIIRSNEAVCEASFHTLRERLAADAVRRHVD